MKNHPVDSALAVTRHNARSCALLCLRFSPSCSFLSNSAAPLLSTLKCRRLNSALREILRAASLRSEHCPGGAQNPQGAISAAQPFEQYLDKRSEAVQWQRRFTKPRGRCVRGCELAVDRLMPLHFTRLEIRIPFLMKCLCLPLRSGSRSAGMERRERDTRFAR